MSRSISLPTNKRDGPRPYRPSLGSAAAAVVPVSRASILRNNMMMVGAKNNERNVSRSIGRAPRRSTLQSIRKSLANDNMALQRHNLPRACGFFLHGENFSSDGGCGYDPRAPRFIGYHGETARSTGSALPLAMPKTISRPLSGSFRAFQRPIGPGRKGEDCEGCTCVDGECWGAPEPLEYYDHSRQKDVRSMGAGSRVSIVKNISVQDTNHRLSQSVSVHVRADSVDRSSQTDEEENRNSHLHLSMKQLSRQSMSGLFPAEKKRSQSYPEHLPRGQNTGGGNAKRYGSSDSELEGAVSMEDHNSSKRRKRSFTNPGTDRLSDHRKLGLPTDGRSLPSKQQSGTNKTMLHKPSDGTDLHTDDRDTIQLSRDYIQQLISEVKQQQQEEMDEDGSDDGDLVENGQLERRPKEPSDRNRPLHYHKYSEQSGKGNFMAEKDPAVTSETSLIMQRLDSLSVPKVTHDQSEQTAQAETARPVRHQSEQTVQEVQPRKVFRDIGEQTTKQVTWDEGEQALPPRRVSQDRGEQTAKLLTREEADQTSRRMLRDVAEQTTRRMSKDEAEQTKQVVKEKLQRNASPRREGPEDRRIVPFKSSSQMFEPVTNQVDKFNNTRTNSQVEEKRLPAVESESRTDHGSAENDKDDWVKGNRVVDGYNVRPTMDTREDNRSGAKPQNKEVFEGDSETITDSSDCTLSDGEYVTNPRLARITLSQLDRKRKKRKARRKRGMKKGNQEATSSAEHTEEEDETEEDEEDGLVPGRRRSRGQVVTLEYESVTEFVDASDLHPAHRFHQSKFGTFNPAIYPSESQHSNYSNAEVHRTESAGQFDYHEIEEDGIELDVSVSQGSEHGELPYSHVAREDIVKLPDILGGNKRGS